ncbi:hypothetical protein MRY87_11585 [bacterium]|nr:hypothetical protein [bacterium]
MMKAKLGTGDGPKGRFRRFFAELAGCALVTTCMCGVAVAEEEVLAALRVPAGASVGVPITLGESGLLGWRMVAQEGDDLERAGVCELGVCGELRSRQGEFSVGGRFGALRATGLPETLSELSFQNKTQFDYKIEVVFLSARD